MTTRVTFLLSKDPIVQTGGDLAVIRLMMGIARESYDVDCLCLSGDASRSDEGITRVAKPPVSARKILARSLRSGRSLVHTRFDVDEFVDAIDHTDSPTYVAHHSYMSESYLRSTRARSGARLLISSEVPESMVWNATRGMVGRLDGARIRRDELRVALAADSVAAYEREEVDYYRKNGARNTAWLDISMPPMPRIDISATAPRLVFFGDRSWPPNAEALELLLRWWPEIAHGIPGAELCIVGRPKPDAVPVALPDGVQEVGFVEDLEGFLGTCRALAAPIQTGGGVRVKILDAVKIGLPVVSTSIGIGSLRTIFDLPTFDTRESFVERCREFLLDRNLAVAESSRLWELNADRWTARAPHRAIENWLRGPV